MDAGLPRYNTPSRYLDNTTKSPYGRTVINQYLHKIIKAAGPRQISGRIFAINFGGLSTVKKRVKEELMSWEDIDSDNNSI